MVELKGTYKKRYTIRAVGRDGLNKVVTIPPEVIERKAEEVGLSLKEFIGQYQAIAQYDNFDGVFITFEPIGE